MLLYLSSNQNIGLFDFLMNDHGIPVKKLSGEFYLNKFVIRDMRNFSHYSFIVFDLKSLKDSENEIIEAIIGFRTMYDSRIIILAEGRSQGDELLSKLYNEGILNVITSQTIEDIKEEILECVSTDGMGYKKAIGCGNEALEGIEISDKNVELPVDCSFSHNGLKIAVAGVTGKVGTTTTALNMAHFLANLGARVSYLEANQNGHINLLPLSYNEIIRTGNFMEYKGVKYFSTKVKYDFSDFHFNIIDVGILMPEYLEIFKKCDTRILCATSKPYELNALTRTIELVENIKINCLFSFASEKDRKSVRETIKSDEIKTYFTRHSVDLFDGNMNRAIWSNILAEYIDTKELYA